MTKPKAINRKKLVALFRYLHSRVDRPCQWSRWTGFSRRWHGRPSPLYGNQGATAKSAAAPVHKKDTTAMASAAAMFMYTSLSILWELKKHLYLEKLAPEVLNDMVKAVYVHAPDKSSGHRVQDVDISYNHIGILPTNLLYDIMNGKAAWVNHAAPP